MKLISLQSFFFMFQMTGRSIFFIFYLLSASMIAICQGHPVDITIGREYYGEYISKHPGKAFDYLQGRKGEIIGIFYGSPSRNSVNSLQLMLLDPRYQDQRTVLLALKGVLYVNQTTGSWQMANHSLTFTKIWKKRELEIVTTERVTTTILFQNLDSEDYEEVTVTVQMKGDSFDFTAELKFYNQIISTMLYSFYVTGVVLIQIYSAYMLLKVMDTPNYVFGGKFSLLTLSVCNIQDFAQTMTHIQLIMGSSSGYLFFVMPALTYLTLFIFLEMKMLFLVWKSHNLETLDHPQLLRKHLTSFYFQFYLGLFAFLSLNYFFGFESWMVLLRNLVLLPQLIHNVRLGQKPLFNPYYVFGFIGSRLLIPIYERACPENRFRLAPNTTLVVVLVTVFACQVILLVLQNRLGSRFFVPKRFLPNYYNYRHKVCRSQHINEDCAICLQNLLEMPTPTPGINEDSLNDSILHDKILPEAIVMKTPCNHKFHDECLTQWLDVKLECPTCRAILPPL